MANLPLAGLNIAVTRPRDQAAQLTERIVQAGGKPILFPLLEIEAVQDSKALQEQVSRLGQFDLAIFISPNAVNYGIAAIRSAGELPDRLKIATIGPGSVKALRGCGITRVIAPTQRFDSEGLLALPELQDVAGWRVIIFRGDGGRELLGNTLKARSATVEYATCYQRSKAQQDVQALLNAEPDVITVTSSEALGNLWQMPGNNVQAKLRAIPIFLPHQRIAELALQQGWQHVQLTAAGDEGLLSALIGWGREKAERK